MVRLISRPYWAKDIEELKRPSCQTMLSCRVVRLPLFEETPILRSAVRSYVTSSQQDEGRAVGLLNEVLYRQAVTVAAWPAYVPASKTGSGVKGRRETKPAVLPTVDYQTPVAALSRP